MHPTINPLDSLDARLADLADRLAACDNRLATSAPAPAALTR